MPPVMGMDATRTTTVEAILERALRGELSEDDAFGPGTGLLEAVGQEASQAVQ